MAAGKVFVDRTSAGEDDLHEAFATRSAAPLSLEDGRVRLHLLVDWSSVEVFANDETAVLTSRIFPAPESEGVAVFGAAAVFGTLAQRTPASRETIQPFAKPMR